MEAHNVEKIINDWAAAVRTRNIDRMLSHHAREMLMFDFVGPPRIVGLDTYRRTWIEQFFPWHGGTGRFDLVDLKVTAGSDVAFATALLECAGTENGRPVAFTLRLTICLEKRDSEWTVVHEQHSQSLEFDVAPAKGKSGAK